MSKITTDTAYLRVEQVAMLGEGEPEWVQAVAFMTTKNADLRNGALAMLPFLMKRLTDDEWAEAIAEAKVFQRRLGGKG